jgi:hypothetical protein
MTTILVAMRAAIIWWVSVSLAPIEVVLRRDRVGARAPRRAVMRSFVNGHAGRDPSQSEGNR